MDNNQSLVAPSESNVAKLEEQFFGKGRVSSDIIEFDKLLKFLQRFKFLLLFFLLIGGLIGYITAQSEIPYYRTTAKIIVEPETSNKSAYLNESYRYYIPRTFFETQQVILKSKAVIEKAARSLSPVLIQRLFAVPNDRWIDNYKDTLVSRLYNWLALIGIDLGRNEDSRAKVSSSKPAERSFKQIVKKIQESISVRFGETDRLMSVSMVSNDPLVATIVANSVADSYINYLLESRVTRTERAGKWLAERIEDSRNRLTEAENELREFQYQEQLFDLSTEKNISSGNLGSANTALFEAEQNVADLSKKYGPKHPELIEAKKKLSIARNRYGKVFKEDLGSSESLFELSKLERAVTSNRELYELFLSRFNEVELGIDSVSSNSRVIERAAVPVSPFTPNIKKSATTGAMIGLFIGILLIVSREFFDRTFKDQVDVEERLKIPVLGVLPLLSRTKFRKNSNVTSPERFYGRNPKSIFAEAVNHIRTGIVYSNVDHPPKVILVASALPPEGKTTCATNLSLAFSKLGKTLLIDADFRKPRIAKISNIKNINGLTGYVVGENSLEECITQDMDSENLFIMRSGEVPPNPLELISSVRFRNTLELMKKKFDYIIVDSAPIMPVSDGVVLGKLVDSIILVLKAGNTSYPIVESTLKRLAVAKLKPVGIVLSQLDYNSNYYYRKYGYYASQYYG